jgi:hypothetical protein
MRVVAALALLLACLPAKAAEDALTKRNNDASLRAPYLQRAGAAVRVHDHARHHRHRPTFTPAR